MKYVEGGVQYADGGVRTIEAHTRKNTERVFIDGVYIGMADKVGVRGGSYKSEDIERTLAGKYEQLDKIHAKTKAGYVYAVEHPAFPGWCKVGKTTNPLRRLASYQTGDPESRYEMTIQIQTPDRHKAEVETIAMLESRGKVVTGEWFRGKAVEVLSAYLDTVC